MNFVPDEQYIVNPIFYKEYTKNVCSLGIPTPKVVLTFIRKNEENRYIFSTGVPIQPTLSFKFAQEYLIPKEEKPEYAEIIQKIKYLDNRYLNRKEVRLLC